MGSIYGVLTKKQLQALRQMKADVTGNRLAELLETLELTQEQVAAGTGFRQTYISKVCRGENDTITVQNAAKFASFFGCAIEDLFPAKQEQQVAS